MPVKNLTLQQWQKKYKIEILFALIFLLGAFFRFYGLNIQSLWGDEIFSLELASNNSLFRILTTNIDIPHPPAYYAILKINIKLLGNSEWAVRFPSAVAGSLSILGIFLLGKKLYSKKEGLIAAGILSFSFFAIHYSQEARSYSFFLLFSIINVYFLIDLFLIFQKKQDLKTNPIFSVIGYIFSSLALAYTSYLGIFFLFLQGLLLGVYFIRFPKILLAIFCVYLSILLGYAPWLKYFFIASIKLPKLPSPSKFYTAAQYFFTYHSQPGLRERPILTITIVAFITIIVVFLLLCVFQQYFPKIQYYLHRANRKKIIFSTKSLLLWTKKITFSTKLLLLWAIVPYTILYIKSIVGQPTLILKAAIFIIPAIFLLEARLVSKIKFTKINKFFLTTIITIFLVIMVYNYYFLYKKEQYREATAYALSKIENLNPILFITSDIGNVFGFNYYLQKLGSSQRITQYLNFSNSTDLEKSGQINSPYLLFLHGRGFHDKKVIIFEEKMQENHFQLIEKKQFHEAGVYFYQNLNYQPDP